MRVVLHEYFRPTKEEFEKLWAEALITFDASSLLNLYGYSSETKEELVAAYEKFRDRIFLSYQFALEYSRNRAKVINSQISNFHKAQKDLEALLKKHDVKQEQPYLSVKSKEAVGKILRELEDGRKKFERSMASDEESDMLLKLFDGKIGPEPDDSQLGKFHSDGKARYDKRIPPGFEDLKEKGEPDCYGDYIGWDQIIALASEKKRDFILVTDDMKEDWWQYEGTRLVAPLPALRKEFRARSGQTIWLYNTEGFLRAAKEFSEVKVGEAAMEEVKAASELRRAEITERFHKLVLKSRAGGEELKIVPADLDFTKKTPPHHPVVSDDEDEA
jgi:hypothetical protein